MRMNKNNKSTTSLSFFTLFKRVISSKYFFYGILLLTATQAFWYTLSFSPSLFDEPKHLGRIGVYAQQWSPFLGEQMAEWDQYGQMTRDAYFVFYYLMSIALRFANLITDNPTVQVIFLRMLNIAVFIGGLIYFRKAFLSTNKIPTYIINLSLLFLVLTPTIAILPGAVNYDNFVFLLFALLIYLTVRILQAEQINLKQILVFCVVVLLMFVIKWTTVALIAPLVIYMIVYGFKHRNILYIQKKGADYSVIALACAIVVLTGVVFERHVLNQIRYGTPEPTCPVVVSHKRCLAFHDFEIYESVRKGKPDNFSPVGRAQYVMIYWYPRSIDTLTTVLPRNASKLSRALPVMTELFIATSFICLMLISSNAKNILDDKNTRVFILISIVYVLSLIYFVYGSYVRNGVPAAIHGRYLLPILPITLVLAGGGVYELFSRHRKTLTVISIGVLILLTQGGGITTHLISAQDRLYWPNPMNIKINSKLRNTLKPFVKE